MNVFRHLSALLFLALLPFSVSAAGPGSKSCEGTAEGRYTLNADQIYVLDTKGITGHLKHLSRQEYRELAKKELIDPDTILLLDEIDLEVDPPLVAAIILAKPLTVEGTHIQVLAEKLGITLLYVKDIDFNQAVFSQPGLFKITAGSPPVLEPATTPKLRWGFSVLPAEFPRTSGSFVVDFDSEELTPPREKVGEKFFQLAEFKRRHPKLVTKIQAITPYVYADFLRTARQEDLSLGDFITQQLQSIDHNSSQSIRENLAKISQAIETWPSKQFDRFSEIIWGRWGIKTSVRSNNEMDDLLAAGMYLSSWAYDFEGFKTALRRIFASQYTYRAYLIRRAWGLNEKNQSMAILLHPYIEVDANGYNGLARARLLKSGDVEFEFNIVEGASHATNPALGAKVHKVKIRGAGAQMDLVQLPINLIAPLRAFVSEVYQTVRFDLSLRKFSPDFIDMELLFTANNLKQINTWVMQYKFTYNREIVLSVLGGRIKRTELDQWSTTSLRGEQPEDLIANSAQLTRLKDFTPRQRGGIRYVLVKNGERYEIFIWNHLIHATLLAHFKRTFPDLLWIRSGYFRLEKDHIFFEGNGEADQDVPLSETERTRLEFAFGSALFSARKARGDFGVWVDRRRASFPVLFHGTDVGRFRYELPPRTP